MKFVQKAMTCAAFGITVSLALGASGGFDPANARNKSSKMEPPPIEKVKPVDDTPVDAPAAEFGVDGQILDRGKGRYISKPAGDQSSGAAENELCGVPYTRPCDTQATEYGVDGQILDRGKGRPMTKPADTPVDTPPAAEFGVDGQILDRGKGRPITKSAGDAPVDAPATNWEDPKGGQHMIRDRPAANPGQPPADTPAAADDPCNRPGVQCDPRDSRDAAKKAKPKGDGGSGKTLGLLAGTSAAIVAAIVLASSGGDNPTSP